MLLKVNIDAVIFLIECFIKVKTFYKLKNSIINRFKHS